MQWTYAHTSMCLSQISGEVSPKIICGNKVKVKKHWSLFQPCGLLLKMRFDNRKNKEKVIRSIPPRQWLCKQFAVEADIPGLFAFVFPTALPCLERHRKRSLFPLGHRAITVHRSIIRAKRVSNCYMREKKVCVCVCSANRQNTVYLCQSTYMVFENTQL